MRQTAVMLTIGWLSLVQLTGCSDEHKQGAVTPPVQISAHTQTLAAVILPQHYHTSGTVSADHKVSISSRLSGYIRNIKVREGDHVSSGEMLFDVDPVDARQAYAQVKADLADAVADLNRYRSLLADHAVSQQQFDKVRLRHEVAQSRAVQAENQLQYAEVRSPVSGIVVEKHASRGDLATPGQPLLVLEDPSSLLVETYVSEQFVARIHEGDVVRVNVTGLGKSIDGTVRQIVKAADPLSHQFLVKIALAVDSGAYSGMFAEVSFAVGERSAIIVPEAALVQRSGLIGIYVMDGQGIAHYRQLRGGEHLARGVEILAGLNDGDVVAWREDGGLHSGMLVKAE